MKATSLGYAVMQVEMIQGQLQCIARTPWSVSVHRASWWPAWSGTSEQRQLLCPHSTLPRVEFPALDPKGRQKPETGGWLSPTAAKLFCLLPFCDLFLCCLQLIVSVTASKTGSAVATVTADASLHASSLCFSPPASFLSCHFSCYSDL